MNLDTDTGRLRNLPPTFLFLGGVVFLRVPYDVTRAWEVSTKGILRREGSPPQSKTDKSKERDDSAHDVPSLRLLYGSRLLLLLGCLLGA